MSFSIAFNTLGYWLVFASLIFLTFLTITQNVKNLVRRRKIEDKKDVDGIFWFSLAAAFVIALTPYLNIFILLCNLITYLNKDKLQEKFEEKCRLAERRNR